MQQLCGPPLCVLGVVALEQSSDVDTHAKCCALPGAVPLHARELSSISLILSIMSVVPVYPRGVLHTGKPVS